LLEALSRLVPDTPCFEVVVVDNDPAGSAARALAEFGERLTVRAAVEPRPGLAHARNRSVAMARGDFAAFIDDDEAPDSRWLIELHAAVVAAGATGGIGRVDVQFEEDVPAWIRRCGYFNRHPLSNGAEVPWWLTRTGNALVRRAALPTEGPFDPRFGQTGGEDVDLFYRLIQRGARIVAVETARVTEWRPHRRCSGWWMLRRSFRRGGTVVDVAWSEMGRGARLRAWSRVGASGLAEAARAVRHLAARDRSFPHLVNAAQSLGMLAILFGYRYREFRRRR
jgi:succinoglycan biosynthesis protein ExoM